MYYIGVYLRGSAVLELIVLGLIPGTSVQITFTWFLGIATLIFGSYALKKADERAAVQHHSANEPSQEQIIVIEQQARTSPKKKREETWSQIRLPFHAFNSLGSALYFARTAATLQARNASLHSDLDHSPVQTAARRSAPVGSTVSH